MRLRADDRAHMLDIDETFPVKVQPGFPVQELLDGVVDLLDRYLPSADRLSDGIDHLDGVLRFEQHVVPGAFGEKAGPSVPKRSTTFGYQRSSVVNCYNFLDPASPFGGYKQSGWGRERGRDGVEQ